MTLLELESVRLEKGPRLGLVRDEEIDRMAYVLEAAMLACFGLSWPMNAYKGYKARTAKGTSWQFLALITVGYVAGIAAKTLSDPSSWVLAVYYLNLMFLCVNWWVFFRNRRLDSLQPATC